jgi:hypothetical protein
MGVTGAEVAVLFGGDFLRACLTAKDGQEKVAPKGDGGEGDERDCDHPATGVRHGAPLDSVLAVFVRRHYDDELTVSSKFHTISFVTKVEISNVNVPGRTSKVDAEKYEAMKAAILKVTPKKAPGITASEMVAKVKPLLPEKLWPKGEKVGWWQKTVQLDLEAKGQLKRDQKSKPMRWYRA